MRTASLQQMRYWYGCYKRSRLTKIVGDSSECAYKKCSSEKIRAWYQLSYFIDDLKVIAAGVQRFTAAGFIERDGIRWFRVETSMYSYEIEADKL